jgi:hypothetical protein
MYLSKKTYVKNWKHEPTRYHVMVDENGTRRTDIKPERIAYVVEEVAYWRKANAIHRWFVTNVQDDIDDCGAYPVSREQLQMLKENCDKVLAASKLVNAKIKTAERYEHGAWIPILEDGKAIDDASVAKELLPTEEGFFFGSTDYDQYYYEDIAQTRDTLEELLAEPGDEFEYSSSW